MTDPPSPSRLAADHEAEQVVSYRAVSRWALLTLALGIFSLGALANPILWILPLATIGAGMVALRQTSDKSLNLAGRSLAIAGLALAVFFAATATTRYFSQRRELVGAAVRFSQQWLEQVQEGNLPAAHQLTQLPSRRISPEQSLQEYYSEDFVEPSGPEPDIGPQPGQKFRDMNDYFSTLPISALAEHGPDASWELLGVDSVHRLHSGKYAVVLRYRLRYPEGDHRRKTRLLITMQRVVSPDTHQAHWQVESVEQNEASG